MERQRDRAVRSWQLYGPMSAHQFWNHHYGPPHWMRQPRAPGNESPPPKERGRHRPLKLRGWMNTVASHPRAPPR
eukprot:9665060-Lingulodinium_polyedra.AAC.1